MTDRLGVYGSAAAAQIATVGVGKSKAPASLAARMPSADVAAKVGTPDQGIHRSSRVMRRNGMS